MTSIKLNTGLRTSAKYQCNVAFQGDFKEPKSENKTNNKVLKIAGAAVILGGLITVAIIFKKNIKEFYTKSTKPLIGTTKKTVDEKIKPKVNQLLNKTNNNNEKTTKIISQNVKIEKIKKEPIQDNEIKLTLQALRKGSKDIPNEKLEKIHKYLTEKRAYIEQQALDMDPDDYCKIHKKMTNEIIEIAHKLKKPIVKENYI